MRTIAEVLPLNALLARPLLSLTREYERGDDARGLPPLPVLLLALRIVGEDGVDEREAAALARASRRAMHLLLKTPWFERDGRLVTLSEAGRRGRADGLLALADAEAAWTARVGKRRVADVRAALVALVDRLPLELPHYWVTYAGVDPRVTGGNFRPAKPGPPRLPAHGQDWKPVLRAQDSSSADLPLTALLSQALVAFAIAYEERAGALSDAVHALAPLEPAGTPFEAAPARAELRGDGRARLERHGIVVVEDGGSGGRVARLTPVGVWLRDAYAPTTAKVEERWREKHGDEVVGRLRSALEAVVGRLEPGLADHPYLTWSLRDGIRETSSS